MNNLNVIIEIANKELNAEIFSLQDDDTIWNNTNNRREGNDINMTEENGVFVLTVTGITEVYDTIEDAADGLIDMYDFE